MTDIEVDRMRFCGDCHMFRVDTSKLFEQLYRFLLEDLLLRYDEVLKNDPVGESVQSKEAFRKHRREYMRRYRSEG